VGGSAAFLVPLARSTLLALAVFLARSLALMLEALLMRRARLACWGRFVGYVRRALASRARLGRPGLSLAAIGNFRLLRQQNRR
jgi:hypothetical protein